MANIRHNLKNLLLKGKSFTSTINSSKENILNGVLDKRGWQSVSGGLGDNPAGTFLTAAGISDPTISAAIYTLVDDLNNYGLWSKMKVIYPMVGGTATSHSYNLKDTTKFQITWYGGMTHNSNGITGNGSNAYGNTGFIPSLNATKTSQHVSVYNRTSTSASYVDFGALSSPIALTALYCNFNGTSNYDIDWDAVGVRFPNTSNGTNKGFYLASRNPTTLKAYRNSTDLGSIPLLTTQYTNIVSLALSLLARNDYGTNTNYSANNLSFSTIGEGLSDTEASNLYTAIQKFQSTLGRNVGAPIVSDPDAQSFLNTASITSLTQANAVNTLVTDLKGANLWTKMKAIYPMVGGTASSHSYNLKNPAQFQITWNGGITHSNTGVLGNGSNGYGDTNLNPNSFSSLHHSYYSRTANTSGRDIGTETGGYGYDLIISLGGTIYGRFGSSSISLSNSDSKGFYLNTEAPTLSHKLFKNNTQLGSASFSATSYPNLNIYLSAINNNGSPSYYGSKECAFSSIGDGLTDIEASNLYTIIQNYQISLGRSVGPQTVSDADAQLFINTADIQDQIQATAVNYLVTDLKANSLWSKMKAVYPMVGGSATSHSYNLKNPSQYQITWNGGLTHSSNGVTPNGTNGYGDTGINSSTLSISVNSIHISSYLKTNNDGVYCDLGVNTGTYQMSIYARLSNTLYTDLGDTSTARITYSNTDSTGYYITSRTSNSLLKTFKNNTLKGTNTNSNVSSFTTQNLYLGANNQVSPIQFSNRQCAFATIGDGLTDAEASNLYTIIQNYQTILSRQV